MATHDDNGANAVHYDKPQLQSGEAPPLQSPQQPMVKPRSDDAPSPQSPQPIITLTDMSDSLEAGSGPGRQRREQILYSEDFDAIQDYLQHTDSPMLAMSPSWLRRGGGPDSTQVHVFPPVNHSIKPHPPALPTVTSHSSSTIDMASSSIGSPSSTLHDREVCYLFIFLRAKAATAFRTS